MIHIRFARNCAWRAVYVYTASPERVAPLRFALGLDPHPVRPCLFGAIGYRRDCTGGRKSAWHWRLVLPFRRFWRRFDGRLY